MRYDSYMQSFDARKLRAELVAWIREWFRLNGKGCNAVVGISGGKDSSVVAALCAEALGKDKVLGVLMPNGVQQDIADAYSLVHCLGIRSVEVNIGDTFHTLCSALLQGMEIGELSAQSLLNLPARLRMSTLYAVSQSANGRVANTCNLSEDWIGYSTRYGDAAGDFSPLAMLTTDEVIEVGRACGLPAELLEKTPTDGLSGKSDEENLGFSYRALNAYIRTGICEDADLRDAIDRRHLANLFKLQLMPVFRFDPRQE